MCASVFVSGQTKQWDGGVRARHFALERVLKVTGTWNKTVLDPKSVNVKAMIFLVTVLFASCGFVCLYMFFNVVF